MAKPKPQSSEAVTLSAPMVNLLQRAQERFLERQEPLSGVTSPSVSPTAEALVHELQVHQIELEMQNEELRHSQLALAESREDYFDLYDLAPVGYFTVSETGIILKANLTVASMLGRTRSSLINKQLTRFIHKSDQDHLYLCRRASLDGPQAQACELRMRKAGDTYFWAQAVLTFSKDRQGMPEQRIILTDIDLRKQADDERTQLLQLLRNHNAELGAAKAAVEEANRTQANFLSNVTHELRTPLNAILGFSQLLDTGNPAPTPSQKRRIDQISKAGWTLLEMVDRIIALAGSQVGQSPQEKLL
jgi:PAS domain S-box-containing protein